MRPSGAAVRKFRCGFVQLPQKFRRNFVRPLRRFRLAFVHVPGKFRLSFVRLRRAPRREFRLSFVQPPANAASALPGGAAKAGSPAVAFATFCVRFPVWDTNACAFSPARVFPRKTAEEIRPHVRLVRPALRRPSGSARFPVGLPGFGAGPGPPAGGPPARSRVGFREFLPRNPARVQVAFPPPEDPGRRALGGGAACFSRRAERPVCPACPPASGKPPGARAGGRGMSGLSVCLTGGLFLRFIRPRPKGRLVRPVCLH